MERFTDEVEEVRGAHLGTGVEGLAAKRLLDRTEDPGKCIPALLSERECAEAARQEEWQVRRRYLARWPLATLLCALRRLRMAARERRSVVGASM